MSNGKMRPVLPALARFYPLLNEWAYLLLRITAGLMLIPHVWLKVGFGPTAVAANVMAKRGLEPACLWSDHYRVNCGLLYYAWLVHAPGRLADGD